MPSAYSKMMWPISGACFANPDKYSGWRVKVCFGGKESQVSMQWRTVEDQLFVYCPTQMIRVDYTDTVKCPDHIQGFSVDQRIVVNDRVIPKAECYEMV